MGSTDLAESVHTCSNMDAKKWGVMKKLDAPSSWEDTKPFEGPLEL